MSSSVPSEASRPDGVFVGLFTTGPGPEGLGTRDVEMARLISSVVPFWRAVLGYSDRDDGPVEELNDPRVAGRLSASNAWMLHGRSATGSISMSGCPTKRPRPEGNEACVATWIGTDGAGYP